MKLRACAEGLTRFEGPNLQFLNVLLAGLPNLPNSCAETLAFRILSDSKFLKFVNMTQNFGVKHIIKLSTLHAEINSLSNEPLIMKFV